MKGIKKFSTFLKEELANDEFRKYFEEEGIYVDIAVQIARLRDGERYSQKELARLLGTTQQTISRLENPRNKGITIHTLFKIARLFKKGLHIQFV